MLILKIADIVIDSRCKKGSIKWFFYGDLAKISVSPLLREDKESFKQNNTADDFIRIMSGRKGSDPHDESHVEYKRLICRKTDDTEFIIVFDTLAYILNDKGETIEKIVVNLK